MDKNFKPNEEFFNQLDTLLIEKLGTEFTIKRDIYGNYFLETENHHIMSFHRDSGENKNVKKRH